MFFGVGSVVLGRVVAEGDVVFSANSFCPITAFLRLLYRWFREIKKVFF